MREQNNMHQYGKRIPRPRTWGLAVVFLLAFSVSYAPAGMENRTQTAAEELEDLLSSDDDILSAPSVKKKTAPKPDPTPKPAKKKKKKKSVKGEKKTAAPEGHEEQATTQASQQQAHVPEAPSPCGFSTGMDKTSPKLIFQPPLPERRVLDNGLVCHVLEDREVPMFHTVVMVKAGFMAEPAGKDRLSLLTARVLRAGGSRDLKGMDFENALSDVGATIEVSVDEEAVTATLHAPADQAGESIALLTQLIFDPAFPEEAFNRHKASLLRIGPIGAENKVGRSETKRQLFGEKSFLARARNPVETESIQLDDVLAFYQERYKPHNMIVGISGDLGADALFSIVRQAFGDVPESGPPLPEGIDDYPSSPGTYKIRQGPSAAVMGFRIPSRSSQDIAAYQALTEFLRASGFDRRPASGLTAEASGLRFWVELHHHLDLPGGLILGTQDGVGDAVLQLGSLRKQLSVIAANPIPSRLMLKVKNTLLWKFIFPIDNRFH
ncbi:M16 family metallopeptidase, partial [Acidobacteriota bacterium]